MKTSLSTLGHSIVIQILPQWEADEDAHSDVTLHLFGLSRYSVKRGPLNVLWIISHPDEALSLDLNSYDLILVASIPFAQYLARNLRVPVVPLIQFADTRLMYPDFKPEHRCDLLFAGNSRKVFRPIIQDVLPTQHDLHVWGTNWEPFLPSGLLKGEYFPYENLRRLYSSSRIVLNDHWEDMTRWGFVNNRIFDALACRGFLLSDRNTEVGRLFPGSVVSYDSREDLHRKCDFYLSRDDDRRQLADLGYRLVTDKHGVDIRMREFLDAIQHPPRPSHSQRLLSALPTINETKSKTRNNTLVHRRLHAPMIREPRKDRLTKFLALNTGAVTFFLLMSGLRILTGRKPLSYGSVRRHQEFIATLEPGKRGRTRRSLFFGKKEAGRLSDNLALNFGTRKEIIPYLRRPDIPTIPEEARNLVSIIVVNRNGAHYLRKLLPSLKANTVYPDYEFILVDNASTDDSVSFIESYDLGKPSKVIRMDSNRSFSTANNIGSSSANGSYLVFMNNDMEVCYGWLTELLHGFVEIEGTACAGATLIYAENELVGKGGDTVRPGLSVQHLGIGFRNEGIFVRPYNLGHYRHPLHLSVTLRSVPAVTGACQLWRKDVFDELDGFDESYTYGYEDVDICLRAMNKGYEVVHCPGSWVIHHEFGTQKEVLPKDKQKARQNNIATFKRKWFHQLNSEFWVEKTYPREQFWTENRLTIAITVSEFHGATNLGDYFVAVALGKELEKLGYRIIYLPRRPIYEWDSVSDDVDVLLVMLEDYPLPDIQLRQGIVRIAWIRNWIDRWSERPWLGDFDMILASSKTALGVLAKKLDERQYRGVLRLAAEPDRYRPMDDDERYASDLCFVGNIFHLPRDIVDNLVVREGWRFRFWGQINTGDVQTDNTHPFKRYHEGTVRNECVPQIYNSTKIVLEDCMAQCRPWGCINSRTFEAMACGALVVSNEVPELKDIFPTEILTYRDERELEEILAFYLTHEEERKRLGDSAREAILNAHTFAHRAKELRRHLRNYLETVRGVSFKGSLIKSAASKESE